MAQAQEEKMQDEIQRVRDVISEYERRWRHPNLPKLELSEPYDLNRDWQSKYPQADRRGCYIFIGEDGGILYVGKASNRNTLGRRIGSYFRGTEEPQRGAPIHKGSNSPRHILSVGVAEAFEAPSLEEYLIEHLFPTENTIGWRSKRMPDVAELEPPFGMSQMDGPTMPERPPSAPLKAIEQMKGHRSWAAIEMYRAIREALMQPHEYPPEPRIRGSGEPPVQG